MIIAYRNGIDAILYDSFNGHKLQMKYLIAPFLSAHYHRDLLKGFIIKEIKGKFAGSIGGLLWTLLGPLSRILAYFFVFSIVLRVSVTMEETGTDRFVIYFLTGFFPWIMFAETMTKAVGILMNNAGIITKVVFPVELLPVSLVASTFIVNGIGFVLLLIYLLATGYGNAAWAMVPVSFALLFFFTLGLAFFMSAMCVFVRDLGELFNIIIMLWFYGTPIIYPVSRVPDRLAFLVDINPMAQVIGLFRSSILMGQADFKALAVVGCFSFLSYGVGAWFFIRSKTAFGDVL